MLGRVRHRRLLNEMHILRETGMSKNHRHEEFLNEYDPLGYSSDSDQDEWIFSSNAKANLDKFAPPRKDEENVPHYGKYWRNWKPVDDERREKIKALPIQAQKEDILKAIKEHPVVILCGSTGTGKTTQVPKFLYEAGYCRDERIIVITEPRRIATTSMAQRVSEELHLKREVSFHVRFKCIKNPSTQILFVTDGILFKYYLMDRYLSKFSVIIIDEAHIRSVYSDTLIGLLTKLITKRSGPQNPLKLIIMSATLRIEDFTHEHLFPLKPHVIKLDGRQFPLTTYYSSRNLSNYADEAHNIVCRIHKTLPEGGILVFLTSKSEILRLRKKLDDHNVKINSRESDEEETDEETCSDEGDDSSSESDSNYEVYNSNGNEQKNMHENILSSDHDDNFLNILFSQPLHVLPLYSKLSIEEQQEIFDEVPPGSRLCIISTDLAETSLTIPGIKYVVDSGKVLKYTYDDWTTTKTFGVKWTSRAASEQRAGRSARESEGHCFRLYTKETFENEMQPFTDPDIAVEPIDNILLDLKSMGGNNLNNFPFPTRPPKEKVEIVEKRLVTLGALNEVENISNESAYSRTITSLGRKLARLPIYPQLSSILIKNVNSPVIQYIIALVAAINVEQVFKNDSEAPTVLYIKQWKEVKEKWTQKKEHHKLGDLALYLHATIEARKQDFNHDVCKEHGLRMESMREIKSIRNQLTNILYDMYQLPTLKVDLDLPFPTKKECIEIRKSFLEGVLPFGFLAKRNKGKDDFTCMDKAIQTSAIIPPYSILHQNCDSDYIVFFHPRNQNHQLIFGNVMMVDRKQVLAAGKEYITTETSGKPWYVMEKDRVVSRETTKLGSIELKKKDREIAETELLYRWFGYFLLCGQVFKDLEFVVLQAKQKYEQLDPSQPQQNQMLENYFQRLIGSRVSNKNKLGKIWEKDSNYLFQELSDLVEVDQKDILRNNWPPSN